MHGHPSPQQRGVYIRRTGGRAAEGLVPVLGGKHRETQHRLQTQAGQCFVQAGTYLGRGLGHEKHAGRSHEVQASSADLARKSCAKRCSTPPASYTEASSAVSSRHCTGTCSTSPFLRRTTRVSTARGCRPPSTAKVSVPSSPSVWRLVPGKNSSGSTPMPIRLVRWMRSKPSATTTSTPARRTPLAAQSRLDPWP